MKITVKLTRAKNSEIIDLEKGSIVEEVLKRINIKPDTVVVLSNNRPIPIDDELKDGDTLTILQVSSGG